MTTSASRQEQVNPGTQMGEGEAEAWRAFSTSTNDDQFCKAWLALLCQQLPGVTAGVVLFQSGEANTFLPVAVWPVVTRDLSFLSKVAERALIEGRGVVQHPEKEGEQLQVAYPVEVARRMVGAVVLEATARAEADVHAMLRQLHWGIAWLRDLFLRHDLAASNAKSARIGSVMEVMATALRPNRLQLTLFDIANHVARQLQCSRVVIGMVNDGSLRVAALSYAAWFEKNSPIMKAYKAAMEDVLDRMEPIAYERPDEDAAVSVAHEDSPHARLSRESGAKSILSVPLSLGAECIAVFTLERNSGIAFSETERTWLDTMAGLLPAVMEQKRLAERGYLAHLRDDARKLLTRLFGPRYLIWKFGAVTLAVVLAAMVLVKIDYRVTAKTVIEGQVQRSIVAPFDGFIATSFVRPGDVVKKGQLLCSLDEHDLKVEQQKWYSDREQYARKLREAMADHEMSDVEVLSAQVQQADAQYAMVTDRLDRADVKAPFGGVVIAGDLSQLIGSPVTTGKELFEIAPLQSYRVVLQVDEDEIRHVQLGQHGSMMISGIVGGAIPLTVSKITPMATARDGHNYFRVEASLGEVPPNLRPGMEGVGKIEVGERRLWWVMTHSFTDWLRLAVWNWMP